ncbi:hypothetical protein [Streptomyces mobaraensis]|uniref:Uncharacterized protein n=1 Tax=Streptomyces mobaraensis TaxID=35621 RepID=A0A5N5W1P6_STRMB|nr:hypothetical protein [Streptomyces mobaraensis]KAB7835711.1 hypothetical protein FRZ00_26170 [Streptomyces mobaraensis]
MDTWTRVHAATAWSRDEAEAKALEKAPRAAEGARQRLFEELGRYGMTLLDMDVSMPTIFVPALGSRAGEEEAYERPYLAVIRASDEERWNVVINFVDGLDLEPLYDGREAENAESDTRACAAAIAGWLTTPSL